MEKVIKQFEKSFPNYLEDLKTLVRIPSVSFPGFPPVELKKSAEAVATLMKKRGLENVRVLQIGDGHPYAYGERLHAPGKPTLLLYAHHDVQPPGRDELWETPPFEPVIKQGPGGERIYGRGTADDKAGIIVHMGAIAAFLEASVELPVNVKVLIEGEEECGSSNLEEFLKVHRKILDADVIVVTDTDNFDCGVPALTVALRGIIGLEVEVRALTKTVHSGMWGGPVPDPVMALSKMLSGLVDENGRIAVPEIIKQVRPISKDEEAELKKIPFNEANFRKQSGMLPGAKILQEGPSPSVQLWRLPSLTVNAIQASSRKQPSNIINDTAWAKITVRLVPDMDPEKVVEQLKSYLKARVPWGLEVTFQGASLNPPWTTNPKGPAFESALVALKKGYGVEPYKIGCGGSIGFVQTFEEALGAPALLVGVEDGYTNAHGENESMLVSDLKKACMSEIYLFTELAERWRK